MTPASQMAIQMRPSIEAISNSDRIDADIALYYEKKYAVMKKMYADQQEYSRIMEGVSPTAGIQ